MVRVLSLISKDIKEHEKTYYFAYGMNTNHDEMLIRCPKAILLGKAIISDHRLVFRGVADFEYQLNETIFGALWLITSDCERSLDILEGYPRLYKKESKITALISSVNKNFKTGIYNAMIYKMNQNGYDYPSRYYLDSLKIGYKQNLLPKLQLTNALKNII